LAIIFLFSKAEITDNYNSGAGRSTPSSTSGIVGWWHLDE